MSTAIFYHAGCPICISAEQQLVALIDRAKQPVTSVHLGQNKQQIAAAKAAGVKSVPALVVDGQVFHINFGAALADVG
jgi:predicted DsbA family dithiol-disulfide isomerase